MSKFKNMSAKLTSTSSSEMPVARLHNPCDRPEFILVCEHAVHFIPPELNDLGLDKATINSHVGSDLGALAVAKLMAEQLNAPLVASQISRLVYDCNRPPEEPSAMPETCEIYDIVGNKNLSQAARDERTQKYYMPFTNLLSQTIEQQMSNGNLPVIVTIHSFTGIYYGKPRAVEIGILHDEDTRFADAMLLAAKDCSNFKFERNEPYGPQDGVTHTLKLHALKNGLLNVMIEVRNDLIANEQDQVKVAKTLSKYVQNALNELNEG